MKSIKPRAEVELKVCKSKDTGKLYYGLFEKDTPVKYWEYDLVSEAGKDLISELINAFDLGYDVRFQFPVKENDQKKVIPKIVKMYNEPCSEKKNPKVNETFFIEEEKNNQ